MITIEIEASLGTVVEILRNAISDLEGGALDLNEASVQPLQDDEFDEIGSIVIEPS